MSITPSVQFRDSGTSAYTWSRPFESSVTDNAAPLNGAPPVAQVAVLPVVIPAAQGAYAVMIVGAGLAAWAGCALAKDAEAAGRALDRISRELGERLGWTSEQVRQVRQYLDAQVPGHFERLRGNVAALARMAGQLFEQLLRRSESAPAALPTRTALPPAAGSGRQSDAPIRTPLEVPGASTIRSPQRRSKARARGPATGRHLEREPGARQGRLQAVIRGSAAEALALMADAERILSAGHRPGPAQLARIRAIRSQLSVLQARIQTAYAPLRDAGVYVNEHHPVVVQIDTWQGTVAGKLDRAMRGGRVAPKAAPAATRARSVDAVLQARVEETLPSIIGWGRALARLEALPDGATAAQREQALLGLEQAGRDVRLRLGSPALLSLLTRGAVVAASPSGPPLPPSDDSVLDMLLGGFANALASSLGDAMQGLFSGTPKSWGAAQRGAMIGLLLGAALPGGAGLLGRAGVSAWSGGAETWARQALGVEPHDPSAVAVNALFAGASGALADVILDALRTALAKPPMAVEGPLDTIGGMRQPVSDILPDARPLAIDGGESAPGRSHGGSDERPREQPASGPVAGAQQGGYGSSDVDRHNFFATAPPEVWRELLPLTVEQLHAIYGGGPIPYALQAIAHLPGFGRFAASDPAGARVLADAKQLFGRSVEEDVASLGFDAAASKYRPMLPQDASHPTDPRWRVITRGPNSPDWIPALELRVSYAFDHSGAFQTKAVVPDRRTGKRVVSAVATNFVEVPRPWQMIVDGAPLSDANRVLVVSTHGDSQSIGAHGTLRAAERLAGEIEAARRRGTPIEYVVLNACDQRNRRGFLGKSNAQRFQGEVNRLLRLWGEDPVTVLAADRSGPLVVGFPGDASTGSYQRVSGLDPRLILGRKLEPTRFTLASQGARLYVDPAHVAVLWVAGAVAGPLGLYLAFTGNTQTYRPVKDADAGLGDGR